MGKEIKEWFKVVEIAEMVGLSKVSVYNKIKTIDEDILQSLKKKEKGVIYYNIKAVEIIVNSFNQNEPTPSESEYKFENVEDNKKDDKYREKYILELENEIKYLKEQISIKDELIINHVKLIENEQVLRKQDQQAITLLEEDRARAINEKMTTWREEHYSEPKNEDGFLKRIFKKKV